MSAWESVLPLNHAVSDLNVGFLLKTYGYGGSVSLARPSLERIYSSRVIYDGRTCFIAFVKEINTEIEFQKSLMSNGKTVKMGCSCGGQEAWPQIFGDGQDQHVSAALTNYPHHPSSKPNCKRKQKMRNITIIR